MSNKPLNPLGALFASIVVFLVGVVFAAMVYGGVSRGFSSLAWPQSEGLVVTSEMTHVGGNKGTSTPLVVATFQVDGKEYRCHTMSYNEEIDSAIPLFRDTHQSWQREHAVGSKIAVHYQPGKPDESVYIPGFNLFSFAFLLSSVFGIGFLSCPIVIVMLLLEQRAK